MPKKLPRCVACGRAFRPDRYNVHHRECCQRPECVRERKHRRQRRWYAQKCRNDPAFREREKRRCAEANRTRRARVVVGSADAILPDITHQALYETVYGVVSPLTDTTDPVLLAASLLRFRERGRRVALGRAVEGPDG